MCVREANVNGRLALGDMRERIEVAAEWASAETARESQRRSAQSGDGKEKAEEGKGRSKSSDSGEEKERRSRRHGAAHAVDGTGGLFHSSFVCVSLLGRCRLLLTEQRLQ